jgi:acyl carrier protein
MGERSLETSGGVNSGNIIVLDRADLQSTDRIVVLVRALLAKRSIDRPIGHRDDLTESGLSSLDIVTLMLAVENEFDLRIPEAEMVPANFRSIARIDTLVQRLCDELAVNQ